MDLIESFLFYSFLLSLFYKPMQNGNHCHFIAFKARAVHVPHGKLPRKIRGSIEGEIYHIKDSFPKA